jgi:hypothetical protein
MIPEKLQFITSTRFWAMVIGAFSIYLKTKGYIGEAEMLLIATITGGFVVVKTTDKIGEQIGGGSDASKL